MHHLLYPPFQGPTNTIHLCESDKAVQVWRLSAKLETLYRAEAIHCKCRTLACQVNKLLTFLSTKSTYSGATSEHTAAERTEKLIFRAFFSSKMLSFFAKGGCHPPFIPPLGLLPPGPPTGSKPQLSPCSFAGSKFSTHHFQAS